MENILMHLNNDEINSSHVVITAAALRVAMRILDERERTIESAIECMKSCGAYLDERINIKAVRRELIEAIGKSRERIIKSTTMNSGKSVVDGVFAYLYNAIPNPPVETAHAILKSEFVYLVMMELSKRRV